MIRSDKVKVLKLFLSNISPYNSWHTSITVAIVCLLLTSGVQSYGQYAVRLMNPSFEGLPRAGSVPEHWSSCENFLGQTPPDIHPSALHSFEVSMPPLDGSTYLGMVTRSNETWENVFQRLGTPFVEDQCYAFSIWLARSPKYMSGLNDGTNNLYSFTEPIVLKIWGGFDGCDKSELLAESKPITNTEWQEHEFRIKPARPYKYVIFEVFYKTPTLFPYNGNILLDNASSFVPVDCDYVPDERSASEKPLVSYIHPHLISPERRTLRFVRAKVENAKRGQLLVSLNGKEVKEFTLNEEAERLSMWLDLNEGVNIVAIEATNTNGSIREEDRIFIPPNRQPETTPESLPVAKSEIPEIERKHFKTLDLSKVRVGETIVVQNLYFQVDSSNINPRSYEVLDELAMLMRKNPNVKVEIAGHTNGRPTSHEFCDRLSTARARSVYDYLIQKGVTRDQMKYKGYGKRQPIATNETKEGRRKNQRVEIKILEVG